MNEWDREKRPVKNRGVGKRKHTPPNEKSDCRNDRIARRLKTVQSAMPTQPAPHIGAGWSLQVVPRRCGKQKDTYYFSPSGDRLRSMPEVRRYLERGLVNSVESPKKAVPVAIANNASDEGKSSLEFGSERPLKKIPAHRLIIGYTAKKETAETDSKRRREDMLMESLEHRRILLRNVKAGRLAAERNLDGKLAGGYAWDSASPPTLDTKTRLEREKAVFYDEMSAAAELDAPPRLCKRVRGSSRETDSDEDFELVQEDEDDSQSDDEDSVESEDLEGFDALASAAADAADEEPRIPVRRTRWESMWEEKFNELVEFKKVHGHCDVKQRSKNNTELGRFVKKMREYKNKYDKQQYNGSVLTPSRIARLDELGFTWNRRDGQHIKSFDDRMQELAAFKAEHGHADIPRSLEDNMSLARWAHVVRQSYRQIQKGGKPALALTREMIERLEAIGFRLRVKERGKIKQVPFEERLRSLAEFKDVHGHVNVGDDSNLARFCNQMRVARRAPQPGVTMKLTQDRISALDALGFEWEPQKKKRRKARRDIMTAQYDDEETSAVHRPVLVPGDFQPASLFCDWLGERKSKWKHSRDRPRKDPPLESDQTPTRPQEFHNSGRKRRRKHSDARYNMTAQYDDEESSAVHRLVLVPGSFQPALLFCDWLEYRKSKWKQSRVRPRNPPLGTDQTSTNVRGRLLSGRKRRRMHSDDGAPMIDTCAHPRRSERILELKRFFDEHGKLPTPQSDKGLSLFCYSLRSEFKTQEKTC
ncbi:hypothetical protein THAOC_11332 [Thalassiosira oceanica]|uniref:MBD domain-containing protein n=1 Tax=Thalassiosira oceanica TaxID=159749 RepID=K0SQF4_THAOC|nr:hypothetical protein THAOC_11332 [Thalassiosira oceanica]|eukprot:EJK67610.1 hypothetical protein THAOC_11332 [Thalassiosira oceanica]